MRNGRARDRGNSLMRAAVTLGLAVAVALVLPAGVLRAQLPPLKPAHLNPMIEKLAAGKAVFGPIISDLSMTNARTWARSDADYVWIDMEHNPLNMEAVAHFIAFSNDRSYTVKRGDGQPKLALVARFPPYASENAAWVAKQALDMGEIKFLTAGEVDRVATRTGSYGINRAWENWCRRASRPFRPEQN